MTSAKILAEIEQMRTTMYNLTEQGACAACLLKVSQKLDQLIVIYYTYFLKSQ